MKNAFGTYLVIFVLVGLCLASGAKAQDITVTWLVTADNISTGFLPKVASDGQNFATTIDMMTAGPPPPPFPVLGHYDIPNSAFQYQVGAILSASGYVAWTGDSEFLHSPPQPQGHHQIGHAPSLALYFETGNPECDTAVEVHQGGQHHDSSLWFQLGSFCSPTTDITWFHATNYAAGYNATVAADNNETFPLKTTVVEVHQEAGDVSALWYQVGLLKGPGPLGAPPSITWGPSTPMTQSDGSPTQGNVPTVSVANNLAILVAEGADGALWYSLGKVDTTTSTIAWGDPIPYGEGYNPSVSIYGDGVSAYGVGKGRVVVEAHQTDSGTGQLVYSAGHLTGAPPTSITWSTTVNNPYATGCYPSVALSFDGYTPVNPSNASSSGVSLTATNEIECGDASTIDYWFGYLVSNP